MVLCNALTEWYNAKNGKTYVCVHTYTGEVIRNSRDTNAASCSNAVSSLAANGSRLLTSNEWELASRYRGSDTTNLMTAIIDSVNFSAMAVKWTKGNSASTAATYHDNNTTGSGEPGKSANDAMVVYRSYRDGSTWIDNGASSTAAVHSKGTDGANTLGLYDMSGGWAENASYFQAGNFSTAASNVTAAFMGLRFVKSAP